MLCMAARALLTLLASLILWSSLGYACSRHDIETVYGAQTEVDEVESFSFAVDTVTFDIVVGGTANFGTPGQRQFIYYINNASCQVKWHYLFDTSEINSSFSSLQIRAESGQVYGTV